MTLNQNYFYENYFIKSFILQFLLGVHVKILFNSNIVKAFHPIVKIRHILTLSAQFTQNGDNWYVSPSMSHIGAYFLSQFHAKYAKIVLIFHLRLDVFFLHAIEYLHYFTRSRESLQTSSL